MEAFLVGAVACTLHDLVAGIKQAGGILHSCKAMANGVRIKIVQNIYPNLGIFFHRIDISHEVVQQILMLLEVHGSAMKMFGKSAEILFDFELSPSNSYQLQTN